MTGIVVEGWAEAVMAGVSFIAALGTAVAVVNRWVVAPMHRQRVADTRNIVDEIVGPIDTKIDKIVAEVTYNNGSSLKDAVRRIDLRVSHIEGVINAQIQKPSTHRDLESQ